MIYWGIAALIGLLAAVFIYVAFKLLKGHWFLGWLRGCLGLSVLALALSTAMLAWDVSSYRSAYDADALATVSFNKQGEQQYRAVIVVVNGTESTVDLEGELWRIDLRSLHWNDQMEALGLATGYKVSGINGRYLSLEQEQQSARVLQDLTDRRFALDGWKFLQQLPGNSVIKADVTESPYFPMVDNSIYKVGISAGQLEVIAVNEPAKNALKLWQ